MTTLPAVALITPPEPSALLFCKITLLNSALPPSMFKTAPSVFVDAPSNNSSKLLARAS